MFSFYISISKKMPLKIEKIIDFLYYFHEKKWIMENFMFWDIKPEKLTWDIY